MVVLGINFGLMRNLGFTVYKENLGLYEKRIEQLQSKGFTQQEVDIIIPVEEGILTTFFQNMEMNK